jgi:hypothetical protein
VHPTALLACFRPDLAGRFPEAERAVGDHQFGPGIEPASLQIQQQIAPILRTFPSAIGEPDESESEPKRDHYKVMWIRDLSCRSASGPPRRLTPGSSHLLEFDEIASACVLDRRLQQLGRSGNREAPASLAAA